MYPFGLIVTTVMILATFLVILPILWLECDEIRNVIRPDKPTDGAGQAEFAE